MTDENMTDEEYKTAQNQIIMLAQLSTTIDFDAFLKRISAAYRRGHRKLTQVRELAISVKLVSDTVKKHQEEDLRNEVKNGMKNGDS